MQIEFLNWLTLADLESSSDQSLNKSTLVFTLKHHQVLKSFHPGTFHPRTQNSQSPIDLRSKSVHPLLSSMRQKITHYCTETKETRSGFQIHFWSVRRISMFKDFHWILFCCESTRPECLNLASWKKFKQYVPWTFFNIQWVGVPKNLQGQ